MSRSPRRACLRPSRAPPPTETIPTPMPQSNARATNEPRRREQLHLKLPRPDDDVLRGASLPVKARGWQAATLIEQSYADIRVRDSFYMSNGRACSLATKFLLSERNFAARATK